MTLPTSPESRSGSGDLPPTSSGLTEQQRIAASAGADLSAVRTRAQDQEEAVRLRAGLSARKPSIEQEMHYDAPQSRSQKFWGDMAGFTFGAIGHGAEKLGKNLNFWVDDFFASIEKAGDANLKAQSKNMKAVSMAGFGGWLLGVFATPFLGLASFFGGNLLLTPAEKTLREKEAEEEKKKKEAQKKKDKENEKIDRLKKKGFSGDLAKALIQETSEEKDDEKPADAPAADTEPKEKTS